MEYSQILVIILSVALAILLVLAIVISVLIIGILNTIKQMSKKADNVADSFVSFGETIKKSTIPTAVTGLVANALGNYVKAKKTNKKGE
jgi:predicted PurR-regulated permease PerM